MELISHQENFILAVKLFCFMIENILYIIPIATQDLYSTDSVAVNRLNIWTFLIFHDLIIRRCDDVLCLQVQANMFIILNLKIINSSEHSFHRLCVEFRLYYLMIIIGMKEITQKVFSRRLIH